MRKQAKEIGRNSSKGIRRLTFVGVVVALLALVATAAVSLRTSQAKDSAARQNNSPASGNTSANSLRANAQPSFVPQMGQVKPLTQEEAQKLAEGIKQLINQSTDGLKNVNHPDGSVSIDLEGRFQSVAVAKRDEDGTLIQSCVDNREAAAVFFGIDPQLVGVPRNSAAPKAGATVSEKGGDQ
jgi:hypothetical protein